MTPTLQSPLSGADLRGRCRGCTPLLGMTYGFLLVLVTPFLRGASLPGMTYGFLLVLVMQFLRGAPLLRKILDPPVSLILHSHYDYFFVPTFNYKKTSLISSTATL